MVRNPIRNQLQRWNVFCPLYFSFFDQALTLLHGPAVFLSNSQFIPLLSSLISKFCFLIMLSNFLKVITIFQSQFSNFKFSNSLLCLNLKNQGSGLKLLTPKHLPSHPLPYCLFASSTSHFLFPR
jgi:hypothetical protein